MPSFSIITPTLGRSRFLEETIESVSTSGSSNFEAEHLLIVTSQQTSAAQMIDLNQGSRVIEAPAAGPADAFNCGLVQAAGDFIGCISDDDVYLPGTLERVKAVFDQHPDVDLVYGGIQQIDEDSVPYRRRIPRRLTTKRLIKRSESWHPSLFFRRSILDRIGLLDGRLEFHFWYDFVFRCHQDACRFFRVPDCLSGRRRHRDNRQFGISSLDYHRSQSVERAKLLAFHLGEVPDTVALQVGHSLVAERGIDSLTPGYDAAVLANALEIKQSLGSADQSPSSFRAKMRKTRLHWSHVQMQASQSLKYPRGVIRFLPAVVGQPLRGFFRSRLFQLDQYAPRDPRLATAKSQNHAADRLSIGIVTPNYNSGAFLQRTIDSVIDQQFPHVQYVVQDGASTDNSVDIIKQNAHCLHHWDSRPDNGQTHAINLGIGHIETDIMAYLNSDDVLLPGSLSFVSEFFRRHPDVDVIYGHRLIIDENDQEIGRWILPRHDDRAILFADYIPQETMFWRRSAWEAVGASLDETFQFAMDWDLILRFRAAGMKFLRVPRFLGAFRVIETQKTQVLLETLGTTEMNRLRQRELGHIPTSREMRRAIRPYRVRQWAQHHTHTLFESTNR